VGPEGVAGRAAGIVRGAARRELRTIEESCEPTVSLRPMTSGGEVVEDCRHVGLTLRQHPASFLRADLARRRIVTCADAMNARDGKWLTTAGLVLVRQKPGSAKGVMFITIEDDTGRSVLQLVQDAVRKAEPRRTGLHHTDWYGEHTAWYAQ
jgi:error-prone DNA polymerase